MAVVTKLSSGAPVTAFSEPVKRGIVHAGGLTSTEYSV